jgi:hypothetical protein
MTIATVHIALSSTLSPHKSLWQQRALTTCMQAQEKRRWPFFWPQDSTKMTCMYLCTFPFESWPILRSKNSSRSFIMGRILQRDWVSTWRIPYYTISILLTTYILRCQLAFPGLQKEPLSLCHMQALIFTESCIFLLLIRGWFQNQPCMLCIYQSSTMHLWRSAKPSISNLWVWNSPCLPLRPVSRN